MKVPQIRPNMGGAPVSRVAMRRVSNDAPAVAARSARTVTDSTSVMGIPEAELTTKVRAAIVTLMEEVQQLRHELDATRVQLAEVARLADQDSLTPTSNRRAFVRELNRAMSLAERYGEPSSVIYFDINNFKEINDRYGHRAGDDALMHVADILSRNLRDTDVVGRLGGDEFGVILTHTDEQKTHEKAEELVADIRANPLGWNGTSISIDLAFGSYTFRSGESVDDALAAADRAMYARKQSMKKPP
jgi:diguanylate cyclase (GGDEF)-like protein